jgi:hypothetical protein
MQHYGIPTRLLDWTESLLCAFYFARRDWKEGTSAAIFILDAEKLNELSMRRHGLISLEDERGNVPTMAWHPRSVPPNEPLGTIAVLPKCVNSRMVSQRSVFTVCGDSFEPLEGCFREAISKIELAPDLREDIDRFMQLLGIDSYSFLPDLEGIARRVQEQQDMALKLGEDMRVE